MKLMWSRFFILIELIFLAFFISLEMQVIITYAENEIYSEYDDVLNEVLNDSDVDEAMDEIFGKNRISIREAAKSLLSGEENAIDIFWKLIKNRIAGISTYKALFIKLLILSIMCALFGFLPKAFGNEQSSQIGHFVAFIILVTYLFSLLSDALNIVLDAISVICFLMNAFIPVYLIAVALSGGIASAGLFTGAFELLLYFAQRIIKEIFCPGVMIFISLGFANRLLEFDKFTRLSELLKKGISYALKGSLGIIIGFQFIQNLITPYVDKFNTSFAKNSIEAIPGVGDITSSGISIALGAAMIVKNSLGVVAMIILLVLITVPMLELGMYAVILMLINAMLQPVLQINVQKIFDTAVSGIKLMIQILLTVLLIFLISIALLASRAGGGIL